MCKAVQQDRGVHTRSLQQAGHRKVQLTVRAQQPQPKDTVPDHGVHLPEANHILQEAAQKAEAAIQAVAAHDRAEAATQVAVAHAHRAAAIPGEAPAAQVARAVVRRAVDAKIYLTIDNNYYLL